MIAMRLRRKDLIADTMEHIFRHLLQKFDVTFDESTKGIVLMGKLNDIFETWKNKIDEIQSVISEHQRQMLEEQKVEEDRINKFANPSEQQTQNSQDSYNYQEDSDNPSQKEDDIESKNSDNDVNPETQSNESQNEYPYSYIPKQSEDSYENLAREREFDELNEILGSRQSQEVDPNHMERDHKGRRIPIFTERFRKDHKYIEIMADFFKCLEKGKRYDV